jgi:hypothetical protein
MADKTHLPKRRRGWRKGNPLTEEMRAHAQLRKPRTCEVASWLRVTE